MKVQAGSRLWSSACSTEVIVVRCGTGDVDLQCGGLPMTATASEPRQRSLVATAPGGTALGKRYVDDASGIEVLCTKAGNGLLSNGDRPLVMKEAKPLPSSD